MSRYRIVFGAAALLAVTTGCGSADGQDSTDSGLEPGIRLSAPPEAESGSVEVVVEQAGLEAGTEISLYAYRTGWTNDDPTCQGTAESVGEMTVTTDSRETVAATLGEGPGQYWWVVVAPGYTSECGASMTRLLASPTLSLAQDDPNQALNDSYAEPGKAGEPYRFNVEVSDAPPGDDPWKVDVTWYGPFESTPEAVAAGCTSSTPQAATATLEVDDADSHEGKVTVDDPGVYRVVADIDRTDQSIAATTGCDEYSPFVVIE